MAYTPTARVPTVTFSEAACSYPTLRLTKLAPALEDNEVASACFQSKCQGRVWTDENGRVCVEMKGTVQEIVDQIFNGTLAPIVQVLGTTIERALNDALKMPRLRDQAKTYLTVIQGLALASFQIREHDSAKRAIHILDTATYYESQKAKYSYVRGQLLLEERSGSQLVIGC